MRNNQALMLAFAFIVFVGVIFLIHRVVSRSLHEMKQNSPPPPPIYSDLWPKDFGPIVTVRIGTYTFRVPEKYLFYGSNPENRGKDLNSLTFAFWYPDLAPTFYRQAPQSSLRPAEPGRPEPNLEEFVVTAGKVTEISNPKTPYPPAEELARTIQIYGGKNGRLVKQDRKIYGLEYYKDKSKLEDYYFLDSDNIQRTIKCFIKETYINKGCNFFVYIKNMKLSMRGAIVLDQLPNWRDIEQATIKL